MSTPRAPRPARAGESRLARWRRESVERARARFRRLLADPRGLAFAIAFADRVIRPDDDRVAATALERLSRNLPEALPAPLRVGLTLAGGLGILLPAPAMALVRRGFAREVRHLADIPAGDLRDAVGPLVRVLAAEAGVELVTPPAAGEDGGLRPVRLDGAAQARVEPPTRVRVVVEGAFAESVRGESGHAESVLAEVRAALPSAAVSLAAVADLHSADRDPVVVSGSADLAARARERAPRARVLHRSTGASVAVVTPAADLERAATALVATARADRDRDAGSATQVILVGSAAGARFRDALADAAQDDVAGTRLEFHEVAGLRAAIELQAALAAAGPGILHSLAPEEVGAWLAAAEERALVINAPAVEDPPLAWGDVTALGAWTDAPLDAEDDLRLDALDERVRWLIEAFQPALDFPGFARVRAGALSDELAWQREFGVAVPTPSPAGLRRATRYRPRPVRVRLGAEGSLADLARVLVAGVRARASLEVSSATPLPAGLLALADDGTPLGRSLVGLAAVTVESTAEWVGKLPPAGADPAPARVRLIGEPVEAELASALAGLDVQDEPVTVEGRVELPVVLRPQWVTMATERFGILDPALESLLF